MTMKRFKAKSTKLTLTELRKEFLDILSVFVPDGAKKRVTFTLRRDPAEPDKLKLTISD